MRVLAVDIGGTAIKSALLDEGGQVLQESETPSEGRQGGERLMERAKAVIDGYAGYDAIGVSTTGQVDAREGRIIFANENVPGYSGMQVAKILRTHARVPVVVENDVNAAALGEAHFGAGVGERDFLCLTYGTGVGGAIVIGGRIYGGADGVAGEMGHILTHPEGLPCACGQRGCYEQYASTSALMRRAREVEPSLRNGRALFEQFGAREDLQAIVAAWVAEVTYGLISLVHTFNPSLIVLGGGVMRQAVVVQAVRDRLYPRLMQSYRGVRLEGARLGNQAGIFGAFVLARRALEESK